MSHVRPKHAKEYNGQETIKMTRICKVQFILVLWIVNHKFEKFERDPWMCIWLCEYQFVIFGTFDKESYFREIQWEL